MGAVTFLSILRFSFRVHAGVRLQLIWLKGSKTPQSSLAERLGDPQRCVQGGKKAREHAVPGLPDGPIGCDQHRLARSALADLASAATQTDRSGWRSPRAPRSRVPTPPSVPSIRRSSMRRGRPRAIRKHRLRRPAHPRRLSRLRNNLRLLRRQRRPYPRSSRQPRKRLRLHQRSSLRRPRNRSQKIRRKRPAPPCGRITPGKWTPIQRMHRTELTIRNRRRRARRATAATFWPAQALTVRSAQTTAPISRSTVGRDDSAKNLPDSGWRGNSLIAAAGVAMRKRATWTALPRDVGSLTRTMM
jgi:hypothetical protein